MLVLTRLENERIIVCGGTMTITVVKCRGNKVRIGIEAPQEWTIRREEVCEGVLPQGQSQSSGC